ncbi:MAG: transketolase [Bauldia sp.]|uniref:transketolase n=1 Tax=Bauldia sp. TaxID=2575872 RepID=UPI001DAFE1E1|nr:transketolase [Bauldia sp.]MCB1495520.1 transketolase [Bauldia sp.]
MTDQSDLREDLVVVNKASDVPGPAEAQGDAINAIRFLAVDAIERANSGHPGTPMGLAPLAYRLFTRYLRHDPAAPDWPDRDRFVLSGGHASMLLYASLHLSGYDLSIDDLRQFRQWGSRTPGHPERGMTPGVEITTGPLGQGFVNAIGMALAEKMLAARFNRPGLEIVNHRTWAFCGEGDMMEGMTSEASSLAGRLHLALGKLTVFFDTNHVTLEGQADEEFVENVAERFDAYGWHVADAADVNDLAAIDKAIASAEAETERPSLVLVHSHIGYGSPVQDTAKAHGSPLGEENVAKTREKLGWAYPPFEIPDAVYADWRDQVAERATSHAGWQDLMARYRADQPEEAAEFDRVMSGALPRGWRDALPVFQPGERVATRVSGGKALNAFAPRVPELAGGTADVLPSTHTAVSGSGDVNQGDYSGRNIHFGIREHAMGAICNGMAAHGGIRPFCSTFLSFRDYMVEPIRLAAMMQLPVVFVFTHDSIGLGEDGPTHQPIEHLASMRATPGLRVIRPADANEAAQAWAEALAHAGPTVMVLSRQGLPTLDAAAVDVGKGATVVAPGDAAAIIATGSEVEVALGARDLLAKKGIGARVVSMPCVEIFRDRPAAERNKVLPPDMPTVAVEAAAPYSWYEFADDVVGLTRFGASAPADILYQKLGITPEAVADRVSRLLDKP